MTVVRDSRPVPLSRVWSRDGVIAEDLTGDDLGDVLELHSDASAWWVLPRGGDYAVAEVRDVARALDLDQLAVADLLAEDRRTKFDAVGQARLVMTNAVSLNREPASITMHPVSIIVTDRALICLITPTSDFQPGQLLLAQESILAGGGVEVALQLLVTSVINTYESVLEFLESASDGLSAALFEGRALTNPEQLHAFRLRSVLTQLSRLTDPMREVLTDLVNSPTVGPKGKSTRSPAVNRRWTVILEQHTRVSNAVDALREVMASVQDTSLALADARGNEIMKKLTGWAAIVAAPTLITGFVGMNVAFPLDGTTAGFWLYLLIMVGAGIVLFVLFRRQDWI